MSNRAFPKSVQPGIPKLTPPRQGYRQVKLGQLLYEKKRPVKMLDNKRYRLITIKRSRGGVAERSRLFGKEISVKSQFYIAENDFVISKRQIVHGACALISNDFEGSIVSNEYSVLNAKPELDIRYLKYLSYSVYFQQTCFHSSIGVHIEKMIFKLPEWFKWSINLPELNEQQKIANFLSSVDTKIQQLKHKYSLMQQYKKGVMQQLFSQQLRFKDNNGQDYPDWEEKQLGEGIDLVSGYPFKSKEISENNSCTPLMRGINITEGYIRHSKEIDRFYCGKSKELEKYFVKTGDLVLGMDGSKVGKNASLVGINDNGALLVQRVARIRAKGRNSINYFYQHIISSMFRIYVDKVNTSSGIPHISAKQIKDFKVPFPSQEEQQKIANFLSAIDQKNQQLNTQITQAETFKKGLLQQMFV